MEGIVFEGSDTGGGEVHGVLEVLKCLVWMGFDVLGVD